MGARASSKLSARGLALQKAATKPKARYPIKGLFAFPAAVTLTQGADVPREFKTPPPHGSARFLIQQLHEATDPKYAVFLRSPSGQSAKFQALHKTQESAVEAARFHAAEAAGHGNTDYTYYVIEIKHRVGIEHGKLVDESMK